MDLTFIRETAEKAALKAGRYILSRRDTVKEISMKKGITDLVTDVDKKSESMIIKMIKNDFPGHSILAEESGEDRGSGDYLWVVDPLDGTTNFAHSLPIFCVSIGLMYKKEVVVGVVYDPNMDELFSAEKGKGAFLNGKKISVSENKTINTSLISTGFAYDLTKKEDNLQKFRLILRKAQAVRRPGSAAIDLCYVACGRFDAFWEAHLSPWDTAAGQLLVKEAGGRISKFGNESYNIFDKELLASNGLVHEEIVRVFNQDLDKDL